MAHNQTSEDDYTGLVLISAYLIAPTFVNILLAYASWITMQEYSNDLTRSFVLASSSFLFSMSVFIAAHSRHISDGFAFFGLGINGILLVWIFGMIYGSSFLAYAVECQALNETSKCLNNCDDIPATIWDSVYFSMVTFTTLGYGDFQPLPELRLLAGMEAFMGYIFLGFAVGLGVDTLRTNTTDTPGHASIKRWGFINFISALGRLVGRLFLMIFWSFPKSVLGRFRKSNKAQNGNGTEDSTD